MPLLGKKRQLAFKAEGSEGVAETLTAAEAGLLVEMTPQMSFDPEMIPRNPIRASLSKHGDLIGKRPGGLNFKVRLRGSGSVSTEAKIIDLVRACGASLSDLKKITIGAVTGGPFTHFETITGAGGGTGKVICNVANGVTTLYYVVLTGLIVNGEVVTGGTSGATATVGSAPADAGHVLLPAGLTTTVPSLTMACYEDGLKKLKRGARGGLKLTFSNGQPIECDFGFQGVEAGITDVALLSGVVNETVVEPVLLGATFTLDGVAMLFKTLSIDLGNTLAQREDPTDSRGIKSYYISDRNPVGDIDPEMLLVAGHDFHGKWFAGTKMALDLAFGATDGNKFRFFAPQIQYTKIDDADRDGIQIAQTSFKLCSSIDDAEWALLLL